MGFVLSCCFSRHFFGGKSQIKDPLIARSRSVESNLSATSSTLYSSEVQKDAKSRAAPLIYAVNAAELHDMPGHPECAERVPAIIKALEAARLTPADREGQVIELDSFPAATLDQLTAIHTPDAVEKVEMVSQLVKSQGKSAAVFESAPTYATRTSYTDALKAVGAVLALVDRVMTSPPGTTPPTGFAICRPPGHHAVQEGSMGFCLFNSAAIACRYAQQQHGVEKVMIYDFDVHHGNGTNDIFYEDASVLFISSHQSRAYPGTGKLTEVGRGDGEGYSINIPLPGDSGHEAVMSVFAEIVAPAARRFEPDLIIISAGYDAHWRDPLAGLQFRSSTYHSLATHIQNLANTLCDGRVVYLLEGGYDLQALGDSVVNTWLGILGEEPQDEFDAALLQPEPMEKVRAVLEEAKKLHKL